MMPDLTAPVFEIGPKNLLRLNEIVVVARAAGDAGRRHAVSVILTVPAPLIAPVRAAVPEVFVFAQGMADVEPGPSVAQDIAESLVDAGAHGVMLNHASSPLDPPALERTVRRAQVNGLLTMVCAGNDAEVLDLVPLAPTMVLYEPPALIGAAAGGDRPWIPDIDERVQPIAPDVLMMHAGGVAAPEDAYAIMRSGAGGTGSTSGVLSNGSPSAAAERFIVAVRHGYDDHRASTGDTSVA